jgi:hypothetical protein
LWPDLHGVVEMKKIITAFLIIQISGCATIIDGKEQTIAINSSPEGATVVVGGVTLGKTPLIAPVKRSNSNQGVRLTLAGYEPLEVPLLAEFNTIALINYPVGTTTDVITGAAYKYSPGSYMVTLQPIKAADAEFDANDRKVFEFFLKNFNSLSKEAYGSKGEYITSLSDLLKINDKEKIIKEIQNSIEKNSNPPDVARQFIKNIRQKL